MNKILIKTVDKTRVWELDETQNLLKLKTFKKWRNTFEEKFDLRNYSGEVREAAPEKPRLLPLLLAWCVVVVGCSLMGAALYFVLQEEQALVKGICIFLFVAIAGPIPFFRKSIFYICRDRAKEQTGIFFLEPSGGAGCEIRIDYQLKSRQKVFEFVEKVSSLCRARNSDGPAPERPFARCRFSPWTAELFQDEIRFYNDYGVKTFFMSYDEVGSEIIYKKQSHKVRNFICSYLAWLLWVIPGVVAIWGLIEQGWIIGAAMTTIALLPWAFGCYFWKLRRPDENFYSLQWELSSGEQQDIVLNVLKENDDEAAYFIEKLKKHLKELRNG